MHGLASWWSEGEFDSSQVYRQSFNGFLVTFAMSAAVVALFPRAWYIVVLCLCISVRALLERRRAFIFSDSAVTYRPAFGPAVRIPLADIVSVEKSTAPVSFSLRSRLFAGLRLRLRDGKDILVPLDFPRSREISQRLTESLSCSVRSS
jgi:hypothetical protein